MNEPPLTEAFLLYDSPRDLSKTFCCYNCELYIQIGQKPGNPNWCDTRGFKWYELRTNYLVCAGCGTQHCLLHFARNPNEDCLYYFKEGPKSVEITAEDLAERSQWIMERELTNLQNWEAQLQRRVDSGMLKDTAGSGKPPCLNLLPGKSRCSNMNSRMAHVKDVLEILMFVPCAIYTLCWIQVGMWESGPSWLKRLRQTENDKRREQEKREKEHEASVRRYEQKAREYQEKLQALRECWVLHKDSVTTIRSYLAEMVNIPLTNRTERELIRWEQEGRYSREVIVALSCGYCSETGKLCDEWSKLNCPRCGKATLDTPPDRYSERIQRIE